MKIRFWASVDRTVKKGPFEGDPAFHVFLFFSHLFSFLLLFRKMCFFSFKYVSLLTLVSEFNYRCFLCGRCSMEMWCPDDIGRDGVGLGHLLGESMMSNSPEWGGIVVVFVVVFVRVVGMVVGVIVGDGVVVCGAVVCGLLVLWCCGVLLLWAVVVAGCCCVDVCWLVVGGWLFIDFLFFILVICYL